MFGESCPVTKKSAVFNLIWTYIVKDLDGRKKACCTCNSSTRGSQVRILDHTLLPYFLRCCCINEPISIRNRLSNAFGEAPPPKQGFYMCPDKAFQGWFLHQDGKTIPDSWAVPVLTMTKGHPESPWLWEKHCDQILRKIGLT
eukprot:CCRYP_007300-RA/>CCRYP_007300-RA protein AED:0.43 eAED:0.51 QI:0/0/0/1/0/0/2/0/142